MRVRIDIILPCYNPEKDWAKNVIRHFHAIERLAPHWDLHLVIINDGSTKGVEEGDISSIRRAIPPFTWVSYDRNRGKGYALRRGVEKSTADYIVLTDIDFPYTVKSLIAIGDGLIEGKAEVLAGSRGRVYYRHTPKVRRYISKGLKTLVKRVLRLPVTDTQCGLKGMEKSVAPIFLQSTIDRYLYDIEFLWMAAKQCRVEAVDVTLRPGIVFSKMNARVLLTEGYNFIHLFLRTVVRRL